MTSSFSASWNETKKLLEQGLSIVPVREKDDDKGKTKTPYHGWKKYQSQQIIESAIFAQLDKHNTSSVAIICGKISGNLEVIDIDVKNKGGIDALYFSAIKDIYPNLWNILKIHKSPSGGYHILYKVMGQDVPGNKKLAGKIQQEKKVYFLETRGEGGYVLAPPSMGYAIYQNNEIPIITWEDRCSLINLAQSFTEIPPEKKREPKQTKFDENYYETNPFKDFNQRADGLKLLEQYGWTFIKERGSKVWLTKPGGKKNDVHAAYFTDNNLFYVFSTSTEFDSETPYSLSAIVNLKEFHGDWKLTYKHLVESGYGKIKPKVEQKLVKQGKSLPKNASIAAREFEAKYRKEQSEKYPYGIFWFYDEKDQLRISREHLYIVANGLGFCGYEDSLYQIILPFIHKRTEREFFDILKVYIKEEDADYYIEICNRYESFLQQSGRFTIDRLQLLQEDLILNDTRKICNKFYLNCYLEITEQSVLKLQYTKLEKLIFYERVQQRNYSYHAQSCYIEFLKLATGINDHIKNIIGFLAHEFKDESTAYIIVLTEKCIDPKQGGGSGKNLFCSLFQYTTTFINKPGAGAKFDEKFFQVWNGQKIFSISDVDKSFNFLFLKEPSSGHMLWKKLFKDESVVGMNHSPKFIVHTNYSFEISDGGLKRRIIPLEFTDFFTQCGGVDIHFNKMFPEDWTQQDWNGYDTFIAECVQSWLRSKRKLSYIDLSDTGWEKQFIHTYNQTIYDIIQEYWQTWLNAEFVSNDLFKQQVDRFYSDNNINKFYQPSMIKINRAITEYAKKHIVFFSQNNVKRKDLEMVRGKIFGKDGIEPAPF